MFPDGTTGITLSPLELLEKLAALVSLPRVHLVRYGGCLAPQSKLRGVIIPTPRQQGLEEPDASTPSPHWSWARLLKRVFAIAMARWPRCQQGTLRIIAAITEGSVIKKILRHLKLAVDHRPLRQRAKPRLCGTAPARTLLSGPTCARCGPFSRAGCPGSPSLGTPSSVCSGHALWPPMTIASLPRACAIPLERLIA